jgi:plastocyanin
MARLARPSAYFGFALVLLAVRAAPAAPVTLTLHDASGAVVPSAVVYLDGAARGPVKVPTKVTVDQRNKVFVPEVTVVQTGTDISFPNSDSVSHHVYSFAQPNSFELPLYKGGTRPLVRFDHPGVVTLGCNIHDSMIGYIVVVETPHFGTTDAQGTVTLPDVPAGSYQVQVWSPRLDPSKAMAGGPLTVGSAPQSQPVTLGRKLRPEPTGGGALAAGDY